MEVENIPKFAILICNIKARLHQSPDIFIAADNDLGRENNNDEIAVNAGAFIRIHRMKTSSNSSHNNRGSKNLCIIQVLDFDKHYPIYENLYECPSVNLQYVEDIFWPFVISIEEPKTRLRLVQDINRCKWLQNLKINDVVAVAGEMFNKPNIHFTCIIRYIGPAPEIRTSGYIFGLKLLDLTNGYSPQADKIKLSNSLMDCEPNLAIFATANWIFEIPKEQQKKCAFSIINDTIEKFKAVIVPGGAVTGSVVSGATSVKVDKKRFQKNKSPSAHFYDNIEDSTDGYMNNNENKMDRSKRLSNMLSADHEELKHFTENRERSIERRANNTNTAQTQTQPQGGILKNKDKVPTKSATLSKESPEIVVINGDYIDESTRKESDVLVVDMDLAKVLGNSWPPEAGGAAAILNQQKSYNIKISGSNAVSPKGSTTNKNRNKASNSLNDGSGDNAKKANDLTSANKNMENKNIQKSHNNTSVKDKYNRTETQQQCLYSNTPSNQIDTDAAEVLPSLLEGEFVKLSSVPNTELGLGSMVEVNIPDKSSPLHGVIQWIGIPPGQHAILIGVELDDDCIDKQLIRTDGGYKGVSLFKCPVGRGIFVTVDQCSIDSRFLGAVGGAVSNGFCESNDKNTISNSFYDDQQTFGQMECPVVSGAVPPMKCSSIKNLEELCGKFKGIQGHHNSCYLDVTLFSMFAFTPVFDAILYRPPENADISHYTEVQTVLREEIVNPLRKNTFVRADRVMKLRQLLDKLSSVSGLTNEEKDPEEFLNCLLSQIMRAEPFLKINSGQDAYYYQLFVDKDERLSFPSVQQLFEQSFYASDIKLKEVPSCLIIQMPRFGKNYKMYPRILPSQVLDVTDIIEDSPRQCSICGQLAEYECRDCFGALQNRIGLECTSFCEKCLETVHMHAKRANHKNRRLSVPQDFRVFAEHMVVPRLYMELFAVVCIETSHYVTFVKAGPSPDAPWCFFDSMADRKGEFNGYNIPEMKTVPDLPKWLSDDGARIVNETSSNDKMLPEHAKRLFCDAYMCMYQSTDVMMYR